MKKNILIIISILSFFYLNKLNAEPINLSTAKKTAYNFLYEKADYSIKNSFEITLFKEVFDPSNNVKLYYIFNVLPQGFIMISADNNLVPVIAYSFESPYVEGKNPVQEKFTNLQVKLAFDNITEDNANKKKWTELQSIKYNTKNKEVSPLCSTKWDQGTHYNFMCPIDSNGPGYRAYAGCVATAMGQVMKRWNYPENGHSGYAYQHIWPMYYYNYGVIEANFAATNYNWSNMPNQINSSNKIDVATLLFHCGVSVKMNYGPNGSGAHTESVPFALMHYFKYHPSINFIQRAFMPPSRWDSIIIDQLDKGFPMVYSGSTTSEGHAWVVDGYQDSCYFHVNWGWSGWNNGYYFFSNLNSGNGDFTNYQGAVINTYPLDYVTVNTPENIHIGIYPNPAKDYFIIQNIDGLFNVELLNTNGQIVKTIENESFIDINDLKIGLYFIKLTHNNTQIVTKLLILR